MLSVCGNDTVIGDDDKDEDGQLLADDAEEIVSSQGADANDDWLRGTG
jgi:hypothetical protein